MTIDDLKFAINEVERRIDTEATVSASAKRAWASLHRSERALRPLSRTLSWELSATAIAVVLLIAFLGRYGAAPAFAVSGAVLLAFEIAHLVATIRQMVVFSKLDFAGPVVALQSEMAELSALRSQVTRAILLLSPLMWPPILLVGVAVLFDLDASAVVSTPWFIWNVVFGVAVLLGGLGMLRERPAWMRNSAVLRSASDHLTGATLRRALALADEAATFEAELDA